jgi:hypothetical protein
MTQVPKPITQNREASNVRNTTAAKKPLEPRKGGTSSTANPTRPTTTITTATATTIATATASKSTIAITTETPPIRQTNWRPKRITPPVPREYDRFGYAKGRVSPFNPVYRSERNTFYSLSISDALFRYTGERG